MIGWAAADAGMPGMAYTLLSAGPAQVAGLMALPAEAAAGGARPGWTGYVAVADVDAKLASAVQAGATVCHPATDIPGGGRFATLADPHGAVFCLFKGQEGDTPPVTAPGTPGTVGWHELSAASLDSAGAFYSTLFGWTKDEGIDMGPMGTYQLFAPGAGTPPIGGMMTRPPFVPQACWQYYINVEAIDAAAARATAAGGQITNGPMEVPGGSWVVNCLDPQGAAFAMVAPKR
ncbi:MAG: glyoxalase [Burkholderiales bacterium PBB5]|nr:MAG: glyoxalase [Burkholderiales bacterium PBB5]